MGSESGTDVQFAELADRWRGDLGGREGHGLRLRVESAGGITDSGVWGERLVHHWVFTDSSGANYRIDVNTNNVWTSKAAIYLAYDANARRLYFRDGSFWEFGCTSAATEQDAGTMYPTLMQDTNGNQIILWYCPGIGVTWSSSSARLSYIWDSRGQAGYPENAFKFTYNTDPIPHLTSIVNGFGTAENYAFAYASGPLISPFDGTTSFGNPDFLQSVTVTGIGVTTSFTYDAGHSGELTNVTMPYGGQLGWAYGSFNYPAHRTQREVTDRYLTMAAEGLGTITRSRPIRRPARGRFMRGGCWTIPTAKARRSGFSIPRGIPTRGWQRASRSMRRRGQPLMGGFRRTRGRRTRWGIITFRRRW